MCIGTLPCEMFFFKNCNVLVLSEANHYKTQYGIVTYAFEVWWIIQ